MCVCAKKEMSLAGPLKEKRPSLTRSPKIEDLHEVAASTSPPQDETSHPKYDRVGGYAKYMKLYLDVSKKQGPSCAAALQKAVDLTWETGREHLIVRVKRGIYEAWPEDQDQFEMDDIDK